MVVSTVPKYPYRELSWVTAVSSWACIGKTRAAPMCKFLMKMFGLPRTNIESEHSALNSKP